MKKAIIVILIIAVVGAGAFMLVRNDDSDNEDQSNESSTQITETTQEESVEESDVEVEVAATITYTDDGFSVDTTTVSAGSTIQIVNESSETLDFASDVHPVHTDNSEFNVGIIEPGDSATFTVSETGEWGFHNHLNSGNTGEITVE